MKLGGATEPPAKLIDAGGILDFITDEDLDAAGIDDACDAGHQQATFLCSSCHGMALAKLNHVCILRWHVTSSDAPQPQRRQLHHRRLVPFCRCLWIIIPFRLELGTQRSSFRAASQPPDALCSSS